MRKKRKSKRRRGRVGGGEKGERVYCRRRVKEKYERICSSATIKQCGTMHNG